MIACFRVLLLAALTFLSATGSNTIIGWETVASAATGLCYFYHRGNTILTSEQVNAVLAGFVANSAVSRSRTERTIDLKNPGNGAPTGQGLVDYATLTNTVTPPGTNVWTVTHN